MEPDDLYGLPLDQFTEERNSLAKQLRADGRRAEAAEVAKLRKPSVAAWAVNQVVRTQRRDVSALLKAGDALQRAQAELLAGRGDPASLRRAVDAERHAVDQLTGKARGLLSSDGHELTSARLEHVSETLHALALDEHARSQARDGRLERELRHIGLGDLAAATRSDGPTESKRSQRSSDARASKKAAELKAARQAEAAALRDAGRATRDFELAQQRRDRASEALRDAEQALARAKELATQTAQQLRRAQRTLGKLEP